MTIDQTGSRKNTVSLDGNRVATFISISQWFRATIFCWCEGWEVCINPTVWCLIIQKINAFAPQTLLPTSPQLWSIRCVLHHRGRLYSEKYMQQCFSAPCLVQLILLCVAVKESDSNPPTPPPPVKLSLSALQPWVVRLQNNLFVAVAWPVLTKKTLFPL